MGKGARARKQRVEENKPAMRARATAKNRDTVSMIIGIAMLLVWSIILFLQIWSQIIMYDNLAAGVYEAKDTAEEVARLSDALPLGTIGITLITIGLIACFILQRLKMPMLSTVGWGIALCGAAFFVFYALEIQALFPYYALEGVGIAGRGMNFNKMILRYYSAAVPLLLPLPALIFSLKAKQYRDIAEVMETSSDGVSTISLGDED